MTLLPEVEISGIFTGEPLELTTKVTQLFYTLFARQIAENNIFQKYPEHVLRLALLHAGYTVQDIRRRRGSGAEISQPGISRGTQKL
jgi:hypothetical protein